MINSVKARLAPAIGSSLASLLYPQILLLFFLPLLVSLVLIAFGLWMTWGFWLSYFQSGPLALQPYWIWLLENSPHWMAPVFHALGALGPILLVILLVILAIPFVIALNLLFVSILASTYLVKFLASREYKDLQLKGRSRFFEGLWNTVKATILFLFYWLISLPLWLVPGFQVVIPFLLTAWLNRRICSFDSLTDFATDEEMQLIQRENSGVGYMMGLVTSWLNFLPVAFFISPVMTMVGFIHLNLQSLQKLRAQNLPPKSAF